MLTKQWLTKKTKFNFSGNFISRNKHYLGLILIIGTLIFTYASYLVEDEVGEQYDRFSEDTKVLDNEIMNLVQSSNLVLNYVAKQISTLPTPNNNLINRLLSDVTVINNIEKFGFNWTMFDWVNDKDQMVISSALGVMSKPHDYSGQKFIQEARATPGKMIVSTPSIGSISSLRILPVAMTITGQDGKIMGTLAAGIDINGLTNKLKENLDSESTIFTLVDNSGNVLLTSQSNLKAFTYNKSIIKSGDLVLGKSLTTTLKNNGNYYFFYKKIPELDLILFVGDNENIIADIIFKIYSLAFLAFALISLVICTIVYFIQRNVFLLVSSISKDDFADKMNLIKYSDRAREELSYILQKTLQEGMIDHKTLKLAKTDIHHLISEAVLICSKDALAHHITIDQSEANAAIPGNLICDQLRIKQVIISALRQLLLFTEDEGSITVELQLNENADLPATYLITLKNNRFKLSDFNTIMNERKNDDVINNFIYMDFTQMEYYVKLHNGKIELANVDGGAVAFVIQLPSKYIGKTPGTTPTPPKPKESRTTSMGSNVVKLERNKKDD